MINKKRVNIIVKPLGITDVCICCLVIFVIMLMHSMRIKLTKPNGITKEREEIMLEVIGIIFWILISIYMLNLIALPVIAIINNVIYWYKNRRI